MESLAPCAKGYDHMASIRLRNILFESRSYGDRSSDNIVIIRDRAAIKECLENNADPNLMEESGRTVMHVAAIYNMPDVMALALAKGGNPNAKSDELDMPPPLCYAAVFGDVETARLLIDAGADIDAPDKSWARTPLMEMSKENWKAEIAQMLIDAGANMDYVSSHTGFSVLSWALIEDNDKAAIMLIEAGANFEMILRDRSNAVDYCVEFNKWDVFDQCVAHGLYIKPKWRKSHYAKMCYDEAITHWEEWYNAGRNIADVTAQHLVWAANVGTLQTMLQPAQWYGHEEQLSQLMNELPVHLYKRITRENPELLVLLAPPTPVIQGWSAVVDAKEVMQWQL